MVDHNNTALPTDRATAAEPVVSALRDGIPSALTALPHTLEVVAVHRGEDRVATATGGFLPIEKYLDADGEECEPSDAIFAVAGFDYTWVWVDLRDYRGSVQ